MRRTCTHRTWVQLPPVPIMSHHWWRQKGHRASTDPVRYSKSRTYLGRHVQGLEQGSL